MSFFERAIPLPLHLVPRDATMRVLSGPLRGSRWVSGAATHGCRLGRYERLTQRVYIREHVRLNDIKNVHVQPIAVSDRNGVVQFAMSPNPAIGGLSASGETHDGNYVVLARPVD